MQSLFLIKYGELALKGKNRGQFERRLCTNIRRQLSGSELQLARSRGRLYLQTAAPPADVVRALAHTFGIIAYSQALQADKEMGAIREAACRLAEGLAASRGKRFKIEARRSDKSFPLDSYGIACDLGDLLRSTYPQLAVDLHRPDWILNVEIRDKAYLYGPESPAPGGLPLGSSGRGLLMLSGGIDSPVAGYLMGKRGLAVDAVHFHTPPYTSERSKEKVARLAGILSQYLLGLRLFVVPFTPVQLRIRERAREEESTLLVRACMIKVSEMIARRQGGDCLVSGESLGQVASQTLPSLAFTGSLAGLPLLRPLIGMDKEEIIDLARRIGTFETSILPYEDCCTLFSPAHPLVKPALDRMQRSFASLEVEPLLERAVLETQLIEVG